MFLCQQFEEVRETDSGILPLGFRRGVRLIRYRVELVNGQPTWKLHSPWRTWWAAWPSDQGVRAVRQRASRETREEGDERIPFIESASPNKLVTMVQAEKLTGILRPAALDYLTDRLVNATTESTCMVENYVKPPKPAKEPKPAPEPPAPPTKAELARAKQMKAEAKVAEWEARATHATKKIKEWQAKARRQKRRADALEQQEAVAR